MPICEQVIADVATDGTITDTVSMDGCGAREYQEDPDRQSRIGAVKTPLLGELKARQAVG